MSEFPDSSHSGVEKGSSLERSAGTPKPIPGFPFASKPLSAHGPQTVVNPERRGVSGASDLTPPVSAPASGLWRRLFPPDDQTDGDSSFEGVAGVELGHFVIEERIGMGGMGSVFRALDKRLQRIVALKVLSPAQSRDLGSIQRFQNEARATARLDHDNIARVYFIGEDQGLHFIAYEYVTGTNVREVIRERGSFDPAEAVNYTLQISAALKHTSAAGVIHRDIKPSNIIITPAGRAKLVDLGLARKENTDSLGDLTLAGTTLGTFDYISPEQAKDPRSVDVRSDIYSLGCTLYHMLTGEPPYPEGTVLQKLLDHQGKDPPDPAKKNPRVFPQLSAVVRKMMASDPRRRYADADQLIRDLLLVAAALGMRNLNPEGLVWASSAGAGSRFWEKHLGWMATAALLLVIVFLVDWHGDQQSARSPILPNAGHGAGTDGNPAASVPDDQALAAGQRVIPLEISPALSSGTAPGEKPADQGAPSPTASVAQNSTTVAPNSVNPATNAADQGPVKASDPFRTLIPSPLDPSQEKGDKPASLGPGVLVAKADPLNGDANSSPPGTLFEDIPIVTPPEFPRTGNSSVDSNPRGVGSDEPSVAVPLKSKDPAEVAVAPSPVDPKNGSATGAGTDENPKLPTPAEGDVKPVPPPVLIEGPPPISIISRTGGEAKSYLTLEAACHAAEDGNEIVLSYNGRRGENEKPLRITNKKITLRAAEGYRPLITFESKEVPAEGPQTRMITLTNAAVELINLDLLLSVREAVTTDQWALFSLSGAERVTLKGVTITVENPGHRAATVVELTSGPGGGLTRMKMMSDDQPMVSQKFEIKIADSFLRGGCDLFLAKHAQSGRFDLEKSVVALSGSLLTVFGNDPGMMAESADLVELRLEHVTCLLGNGLLRMDSGDLPRDLIPVQISARNNIFAARSVSPLIVMAGNTDANDFRRRLLRWSGERNFYDRFSTYWSIASNLGAAGFDPFDFEAWKRAWGPATEVDPNGGGIPWKMFPQNKEFAQLTAADLQLDPEATSAVIATDGGNAGADLSKLPKAPSVLKPLGE